MLSSNLKSYSNTTRSMFTDKVVVINLIDMSNFILFIM